MTFNIQKLNEILIAGRYNTGSPENMRNEILDMYGSLPEEGATFVVHEILGKLYYEVFRLYEGTTRPYAEYVFSVFVELMEKYNLANDATCIPSLKEALTYSLIRFLMENVNHTRQELASKFIDSVILYSINNNLLDLSEIHESFLIRFNSNYVAYSKL